MTSSAAAPVDPERLVREGYDQIAEHYLAQATRPGSPRLDWVGRLAGLLAPGSAVLDIGCGAGVPVASSLVDAGHLVTGVDVSPRQIGLATELVPGATFVVGDIGDLSFATASFDAVVMLYVVHHIRRERIGRVFSDVRTWLRPNGA